MSNVRVLVVLFLTHPEWTIWVRATPILIVDLNFNPPNWLGWIKSLLTTVNSSLSAITFSMSLPRVLRRTIGQKALGWSHIILLGLGIILTRQSSCLMIDFKWHQVILSGPGNDESLHLLITCLNSSLEKELQWEVDLHLILLRILKLTWQLRAVLKVL